MNYWDRLASLRMSSLQRRRERYLLIYMWKILNGLAPNSINVEWCHSDRLGIRAILPSIPQSRSKLSAFDNSFMVIGPRLWNIIPAVCTMSPLNRCCNIFSITSLIYPPLATILQKTIIVCLTGLSNGNVPVVGAADGRGIS